MMFHKHLINYILLATLLTQFIFPVTTYAAPVCQIPDSSPSVQTYTDPDYGIRFDYPAEWTLDFINHEQQDDVFFKRRITAWAPEYLALMSVDIWERTDDLPLLEWYNQHQSVHYGNQSFAEPNAMLSGEPALLIEDLGAKYAKVPMLTAFVVNKDVAVRLEYPFDDGGAAQDKFRELLTSFRFESALGEAKVELPNITYPMSRERSRVKNCCGITSSSNPFPCCTNDKGTQIGNCTWYAYYRFVDADGNKAFSCRGNALDWRACAVADNSPAKVGSVVVFQPGVYGAHSAKIDACPNGCGHVAYVTSVNPDGTFYIEEDGCAGTCGPTKRPKSLAVKSGVNFIYPDKAADTTPPQNPTTLTSSSHTPQVWSANPNITVEWLGAQDMPPPDAPSGIAGYSWDWTTEPGTIPRTTMRGNSNNSVMPLTGERKDWYFHVRAVDNAGNWANGAVHLGPFYVDTKAPTMPQNLQSSNVTYDVWQNSVTFPSFTWQASQDSGSGVAGYRVAWSTDEQAIPTTNIGNVTQYQATINEAITQRYFRVAAIDTAGNMSDPTTFIVRYDSVAPTGSFLINQGAESTNRVGVRLALTATDQLEGSGVDQLRISYDGVTWQNWLPYQAEVDWTLPPVDHTTYTVYLQFRDKAGNVSAISSRDIRLEFNSSQPKSTNYLMWTDVQANSGNNHTSESYALRTTGGQALAGNIAQSERYGLYGAYQGAILPFPLITPTITPTPTTVIVTVTPTPTTVITTTITPVPPTVTPTPILQWKYKSLTYAMWTDVLATSGKQQSSASYYLHNTTGQVVAGNISTSGQYKLYGAYQGAILPFPVKPSVNARSAHQPINPSPPLAYSAVTSATTNLIVSQQTEPPTITLLINEGANYTNNPDVSLQLQAPNTVLMRLSNQADFADSYWQAYEARYMWELNFSQNDTSPSKVYAQYQDITGNISDPLMAEITFDSTPPDGKAEIISQTETAITLSLTLTDDLSLVSRMAVTTAQGFEAYPWQPVADEVTLPYTAEDEFVYIFLQDGAGNIPPYPLAVALAHKPETVYLPLIIK